uniref:Iodothyronine deiodinase n=1 Tax=Oryctolagus cuniculus TaxID=9986 RepID=G1TT28_RABIT
MPRQAASRLVVGEGDRAQGASGPAATMLRSLLLHSLRLCAQTASCLVLFPRFLGTAFMLWLLDFLCIRKHILGRRRRRGQPEPEVELNSDGEEVSPDDPPICVSDDNRLCTLASLRAVWHGPAAGFLQAGARGRPRRPTPRWFCPTAFQSQRILDYAQGNRPLVLNLRAAAPEPPFMARMKRLPDAWSPSTSATSTSSSSTLRRRTPPTAGSPLTPPTSSRSTAAWRTGSGRPGCCSKARRAAPWCWTPWPTPAARPTAPTSSASTSSRVAPSCTRAAEAPTATRSRSCALGCGATTSSCVAPGPGGCKRPRDNWPDGAGWASEPSRLTGKRQRNLSLARPQ